MKPQTSKEYFISLTILHTALILGQVLLGGVAYYLQAKGRAHQDAADLNEIFQLVIPLMVIGGLMGSTRLSRMRLETIREQPELKTKLADYRSTLILKYALLEGPSLFSLIAYLLTGNYLFLALSAVIIVAFFMHRPTIDKAVTDLELNPSQRAVLENPESVVTG